ncbi:MAG: biotin--[acetyl-CoA-carboxylase] ligase [Euryarchaeota archaeon]|nr:biotin--[acetyl-CoA-carboxylase] ligase [Euryarchaeota archaeon]
MGVSDLLLTSEIKKGLQTKYIGKEIHHFKEIDSTNDFAKELAFKGAKEGTVVISEVQKAGKGRFGKTWISPSGGIWMSLILRPKISPHQAPKLTLITGVSVAEAIRQVCGLNVKIKWPNDILLNGKKLCGILTEMSGDMDTIEYVVIGIGINANVDVDIFPAEIREGATSLKKELKKDAPRIPLVQRLMEELEKNYEIFKEDFLPILTKYKELSATIGNLVRINIKDESIVGEAIGIDSDGALILELADGSLKRIIAGECIHLQKL